MPLFANLDACDKMLLLVVRNVQKQLCCKHMNSLPVIELLYKNLFGQCM